MCQECSHCALLAWKCHNVPGVLSLCWCLYCHHKSVHPDVTCNVKISCAGYVTLYYIMFMHLYYKLHYEYDIYPDYDQTVGLMPLLCNLVCFLC